MSWIWRRSIQLKAEQYLGWKTFGLKSTQNPVDVGFQLVVWYESFWMLLKSIMEVNLCSHHILQTCRDCLKFCMRCYQRCLWLLQTSVFCQMWPYMVKELHWFQPKYILVMFYLCNYYNDLLCYFINLEWRSISYVGDSWNGIYILS